MKEKTYRSVIKIEVEHTKNHLLNSSTILWYNEFENYSRAFH